ncbi:hypothetical protein [Draconibacterium halophilum]|uniref:Uncharacterized protein n=1 Tax=Draconibacterium halophilum TaxID=2706887 RepID=A0A6C0RD38_9BACT|nr:hypothetical protein [Draconibacterium halophilum]QIA08049.1 hypothetical protein G0Q07_10035 [Draconibacterium halophilum]
MEKIIKLAVKDLLTGDRKEAKEKRIYGQKSLIDFPKIRFRIFFAE